MTNIELKDEIDLSITSETSPASITPTDVGDTLKLMVDYIDQQVSLISFPKRLTLKLTQSGTFDPSLVEMKADINYFIARTAIGQYELHSIDNEFLDMKTIPILTNKNLSIAGSIAECYRISDSVVKIFTKDSSNAFSDGILNNYIIDVTILP